MDNIQTSTDQGRVADAPSGHWVYRLLPKWAWPFAQLARWDRPIGWWLLLWPCWWSAAMAWGIDVATPQAISENTIDPDDPIAFSGSLIQLGAICLIFMVGAISMRGAGCTYNDLVDQKIDEQVDRTRSRPLPSGQISRFSAKVFLCVQALVGFLVLIQFGNFAIGVGLLSLVPVAIYPFMKRITNWPQLFLGFAFSWGALMGWAFWFENLSSPAPFLLYMGCIAWVIGYDTIYAHQDKEDDALVGIGSTALLFGEKTKLALVSLYSLTLLLFACAFVFAQASWPAFLGILVAAIHFLTQIKKLDIGNGEQCLKLFKSNSTIGWIIFIGLIVSGFWR